MTRDELREKVLEIVPENVFMLKSDEELRSCNLLDKMTIFVECFCEINLWAYLVGKLGGEYAHAIEIILYELAHNELECRKIMQGDNKQ